MMPYEELRQKLELDIAKALGSDTSVGGYIYLRHDQSSVDSRRVTAQAAKVIYEAMLQLQAHPDCPNYSEIKR